MEIRCPSCGAGHDADARFCSTCGASLRQACPACGAASFAKQVTAAGFQLKGSGWYVTDFRDNGKKADGKKAEGGSDGAKATDGSEPAESAKPADGGKPADGAKKAESADNTRHDTHGIGRHRAFAVVGDLRKQVEGRQRRRRGADGDEHVRS